MAPASLSALKQTTEVSATPVTCVFLHGTAPTGHKLVTTSTAKPQATSWVAQLRCQLMAHASLSAPSLITETAPTQVTCVSTHGTAPTGHKPVTTSTAKPPTTCRVIQLRCQKMAHVSLSVLLIPALQVLVLSMCTHGMAPTGHKPVTTSTAKPPTTCWVIQLRCQQMAPASSSALKKTTVLATMLVTCVCTHRKLFLGPQQFHR